MRCARVDYVRIYLAEDRPKGPVSGFWEHCGDLCLYFVFKMQISFLNRRCSKHYPLCFV